MASDVPVPESSKKPVFDALRRYVVSPFVLIPATSAVRG